MIQTGLISTVAAASGPITFADQEAKANGSHGWLRKTLKIGMVKPGKTLKEKFALAREAGFEGIELNAPNFDIDEANAAAKATGIIIDGTVGSNHWKVRHTDPDPGVRSDALLTLRRAIEATAAVGADTTLLVPGRGTDGTAQEVYKRAFENISQAIPTAEKHGVSILIENVWNDFLYDSKGSTDQTADELAAFVDDFDSPWVGVQYDIGNHWKFGDPAAWIRTLDQRIKKLDIKGFSRKAGNFTKITEGDIDWPSVKQALRDIRFKGWLAAEVQGGDLGRLKEVSQHLDEALQCSETLQSAS